MSRQGFDNEKYLHMQSEQIRKRIARFGGKLYLEFGGKLFDDYHASRVLPGFQPDSKLRMLLQIGQKPDNLFLHGYIQRTGDFIADQKLRLYQYGSGDSRPLALSAG